MCGSLGAIGRIVAIHPNSKDTFYLCMLLKHVSGATSFKCLRTDNGVVYTTFKEACIALELCEDDTQWIACMKEAAVIMTGRGP